MVARRRWIAYIVLDLEKDDVSHLWVMAADAAAAPGS